MKKLENLLENIETIAKNASNDVAISGITCDSRKVKANYAFFAFKEEYIDDAVKNGATIIFSNTPLENYSFVIVTDLRIAFTRICQNFYDNPQRALKFIGVIGTNGKTTTTHIINHILRCSGYKTCLIGSLGTDIDGEKITTDMTTPDPENLYWILNKAKDRGIEYVIMEISAHAIFYNKLYGVVIDYCIFTNITRDHLDFFKSMKNYAETKRSFFKHENIRIGIINADDNNGLEIINSGKVCCVSYGIYQPSDVFAINLNYGNFTEYIVNAFDEVLFIKTPLYGEFNVMNTLAAITVARIISIEKSLIIDALKSLPKIDGRYNVITKGKTAIIDYAHTPDGLENLLTAARIDCKGKLIAVFGCGGNRDKTKRPIMGDIACRLADFTVITSDNPRNEEPNSIAEQIATGFKDNINYVVIIDRKKAIEYALDMAKCNDTVIIAGKGAESYIEIGDKKFPHSDMEICNRILEGKSVD